MELGGDAAVARSGDLLTDSELGQRLGKFAGTVVSARQVYQFIPYSVASIYRPVAFSAASDGAAIVV